MKKYAFILSKHCLLAAAAASIIYFAAAKSILADERTAGSWLDPVLLSRSGSDAAWPAMAIDRYGTIHVAWHGNEEGNYEIYYTKRAVSASGPAGGRFGSGEQKENWTRPLNISLTPHPSARPSIAVGPDGTIHVAWSETEAQKKEIYYVNGAKGAWSRPLKISSSEGQSTNSAIVAGIDETVHLVWETASGHSADLYYSARGRAGWLKAINLTKNSAGMGSWLPSAVMDASHRLNLCWHDFRAGKPQVFHAVVASGRLANVVKDSSSKGLSLNPQLFLGKDGAVGVVWVEVVGSAKEVYFARAVRGDWGEGSVAAGPFKDVQSPVALQAPDGSILIFFAARTEAGKSLMVVSGDGTKWKKPAILWALDGPYAMIKALVDGKGAIHLLWSHGKHSKNSVYYSRTAR